MDDDCFWIYYALGDSKFHKAELINNNNNNNNSNNNNNPNTISQQQILHFSPHYLEAIKYYLLGSAAETHFFSAQTKIPKNFYTVVKRMITCFIAVKGNLYIIINNNN
jgi:hypothetical protein